MKKLFFGGVHMADRKEMIQKDKDILMICPDEVIIPLSQHKGVFCNSLVEVGDYVEMGQKIGDNEGLCVPVHASVSGIVTAIRPMPHPDGSNVLAIVIKNDYRNVWHEKINTLFNPENFTSEELFEIIREAGIVGMGGAAFPTEIKASSSLNHVDTMIINGCECEPYITADDALMCTEPERIVKGIVLLAEALKVKDIILALEDNKLHAVELMKEYLKEYPQITLKILPAKYPQGAEKQLILGVTGKEVLPEKLPRSVSCVVFNVSTVAAVFQAAYEGIPLIHRIVSVTGEGVKEPQNFLVPIGTPFSVLIEAAGGLTENCKKVISGGPMMGEAQEDLSVPVIKSTNNILCLEEPVDKKSSNCIRCGKCLEVCPVNLQPLYLYDYGNAENLDMLEQLHLIDCIECGCCTYICPANLPLAETFKIKKRALKEGR